jgi:hypothetical protein
MQTTEQEREQSRGRRGGNPSWVRGVSQNPRGRETKAEREARRDAIIAAWAEPFGGVAVLRSAELELLRQGAELSMCRPRNAEDRVRHANTISKIMVLVGFVDNRRNRESAPQFQPLGRGPRRPPAQRVFSMRVENHMKHDEEVARYRAEHGLASDDFLLVRCFIPHERRAGETAKEAFERELREMAKARGALPDDGERLAGERRSGSATDIVATASSPPRQSPNDEGSRS